MKVRVLNDISVYPHRVSVGVEPVDPLPISVAGLPEGCKATLRLRVMLNCTVDNAPNPGEILEVEYWTESWDITVSLDPV